MYEEIKQLKSVEVLPTSQATNVLWENQVLKDGVVISSVNHRCAYGILQREQFLADVVGATDYIVAAGWTDTAYQEALDAQAALAAPAV